ncbi:hypothetical protein PIB30_056144 [Stylosanthes scabra]|uniref:Uncharacterized protein n=1 Tax=Stylosanthes scabra TaxID=79078 RepID=A0ABU6VKB4_9FABA|nr:hypothetical protein [Stylosanthes scabra]
MTLELEHHLDPSKTPSPADSSASESTTDSAIQNPLAAGATAATSPIVGATADKGAAYKTWRKHDLAFQTWLVASITKPYQNKILQCASFFEAWITIQDLFSATSKTRVQERTKNLGQPVPVANLTQVDTFNLTAQEGEDDEAVAMVDSNVVEKIHGRTIGPFAKSMAVGIPLANSTPPPPSSSFHQPWAYITAPPSQNNALAWYPDSGANHHVTSDPTNFSSTPDTTQPTYQLLVGNGAGYTQPPTTGHN